MPSRSNLKKSDFLFQEVSIHSGRVIMAKLCVGGCGSHSYWPSGLTSNQRTSTKISSRWSCQGPFWVTYTPKPPLHHQLRSKYSNICPYRGCFTLKPEQFCPKSGANYSVHLEGSVMGHLYMSFLFPLYTREDIYYLTISIYENHSCSHITCCFDAFIKANCIPPWHRHWLALCKHLVRLVKTITVWNPRLFHCHEGAVRLNHIKVVKQITWEKSSTCIILQYLPCLFSEFTIFTT